MKRALAIGLVLVPTAAFGQEASTCVTAYEGGQVARRGGHFEAARQQFSVCMADGCPGVVRDRCMQFARELEQVQPTVVVAVRDEAGHDVVGARISIDGAQAVPLPAIAMRLDPGEHVLRIDTTDGPVEQRLVVREGERDRRVDFTAPHKQPVVTTTTEPTPPVIVTESSSKPVGAWVFATVTGVSLLAAGVMSGVGWGIYANLKSTCGTSCSSSQVAPLNVLWPGAFVALGVGVVAGVITAVLFATSHAPKRAAWTVLPGIVAGTF